MKPTTLVWRFCDGKPGHDRQSAGLVAALAAHQPTTVLTLPAADYPHAWRHWCRGRWPGGAVAQRPHLVLGAGRACVWPVLAAARAHAAMSLYLMNPPGLRCLFDLCLIPRHDGVAAGPRVVVTEGVLNDLPAGEGPRVGPTLVLIGGPSRHHGWDEADLLRQLASLVYGTTPRHFVISDSRRTPASTTAALRNFAQPGVVFLSHATMTSEAFRTALLNAPSTWVTADSVSMLYEALSAGCAVGLLAVPARRVDRITGLAAVLLADRRVSSLAQWLAEGRLPPPAAPLAEAQRCSRLVAARLLAAGDGT